MKKLTTLLFLVLATSMAFGQSAIRINDLTGINAHATDPIAPQLRFSWVRNWHDWSNDIGFAANFNSSCRNINEPTQWGLQWNPSYNQSGNYLNYDGYFGAIGSRAIPVMKGIDPLMRGFKNYGSCQTVPPLPVGAFAPLEQKPFCLTTAVTAQNDCFMPDLGKLPIPANQEKATTYKEHALWMSMFAAKYGAAKYTSAFSTPYTKASAGEIMGKSFIEYMEDNNEPNKSWYDNLFTGSPIRTGIGAGDYKVTITDNAGCSVIKTYQMTPKQLDLKVISTIRDKSTCGFGADIGGAISLQAFGGISPYSYKWNDGFIGQSRTGLTSTTAFTVTITDANSCSKVLTNVQIGSINKPVIQQTLLANTNCVATNTGKFHYSINGEKPDEKKTDGNNKYKSMWQLGSSTPYQYDGNRDDLSPGNYSITVTDLQGTCSTTNTISFTIGTGLIITENIVPPTCGSETNGQILLEAAGGLPPIRYDWEGLNEATNLETGKTYWYFTPKQFAAMTSADYDGKDENNGQLSANHNSLTSNLGVNNGAESMNFVLGGLSGLHGKYLLEMRDRWNMMRGAGNLPNYISNFHHYCTDLSANQGLSGFNSGEFVSYKSILLNTQGGKGVSPEKDQFREKLKALSTGLGTDARGKEMWITEFGYDSFGGHGTANNSGVEAEAIPFEATMHTDGPYDSQKVQAQWLTRGVLEAAWSERVNKMTLYELTDHPTGANVTYDYSGLMTQSGAPKRAWFYIMTLKNILGESTFKKELVNSLMDGVLVNEVGNTSSVAPRIYEFTPNPDVPGNNLNNIFAIWSPTEIASKKYTIDLTLPVAPSNNPYSFTSATLVEIEEMNEKGRRRNWTGHIVGNTIKDIPVSETPVFLMLNKAVEDRYAPCVSNLRAQNVCCGGVQLDWNTSSYSINTLIYYQELPTGCSSMAACDALKFNPETAILYSNKTGVNRLRATILGLKANHCYKFWVFPVSLTGSTGFNPALCPNPANTICAMVNDGCINAPCLIDIAATEINIDPFYLPNAPNTNEFLEQTKKMLSIDGSTNACSTSAINDLNIACPAAQTVEDGWSRWENQPISGQNQNNPNLNTTFINFTIPKNISAIFAQDWIGNGKVRIEYRTCNCLKWHQLVDVELDGGAFCNGNPDQINNPFPPQWKYVSIFNNPLIKELRITKLTPGFVLRRLFFCGADAVCPTRTPEIPRQLENFAADQIRRNTATLRWDASISDSGDPNSIFLDEYQLKISQGINTQNELIYPVSFNIIADPLDIEIQHRLEGLAPGTTYFVDLIIPQSECYPLGAQKARISFKTETDGVTPREDNNLTIQNNLTDPFKVMLLPNPTAENVQISVTAGNISQIILMDLSGRILKTESSFGINELTIQTQNLKAGLYWIRVIRTDGTQQTVQLIKVRN